MYKGANNVAMDCMVPTNPCAFPCESKKREKVAQKIRLNGFSLELANKTKKDHVCIATWSIESTSPEMIAYVCRYPFLPLKCATIIGMSWRYDALILYYKVSITALVQITHNYVDFAYFPHACTASITEYVTDEFDADTNFHW